MDRVISCEWLRVTVNDPRPDLEEATLKGIEEICPSLEALGCDTRSLTRNLSFEKILIKRLKEADLIQENGPENVAFKQTCI